MVAVNTLEYLLNPSFRNSANYDFELSKLMNQQQLQMTSHEIKCWPGYAITPLHSLPALAAQIGVARIDYKDESERFGFGSFEVLGGAYAVGKLLSREVGKRLGRAISMEDLLCDPDVRQVSAALTVAAATDGTFGRSVAWGTHMFGCMCTIYAHSTVSESHILAIEAYDALAVRVSGDYEQSVLHADAVAKENGWFFISDTSYDGNTNFPSDVMQGYQVMVDEIFDELEEVPTHVFVQAGVGLLSAAVCAYFWERMGKKKPFFAVVESKAFDCLYQSMKQGKIMEDKKSNPSIMSAMSCGIPSAVAWEILTAGANACCSIADDAVAEVVRLLAFPLGDDPVIVASPSGVAGLAAVIGAMQNAKTRVAMGLDGNSRILVFGTEGDTDPALYQNIVGATAEQVRAGIKLD